MPPSPSRHPLRAPWVPCLCSMASHWSSRPASLLSTRRSGAPGPVGSPFPPRAVQPPPPGCDCAPDSTSCGRSDCLACLPRPLYLATHPPTAFPSACPRPRPFLQMNAATFRDGLFQGATVSTNGEFVEFTRRSLPGEMTGSSASAPEAPRAPGRLAAPRGHHRPTGMFPCIAGSSARTPPMPTGRQSRRWSSEVAPSPSSMPGDATMPAFPGSQHRLANVPKDTRVPLAWEVRRALERGQEQA